jgi:hypothetical protein
MDKIELNTEQSLALLRLGYKFKPAFGDGSEELRVSGLRYKTDKTLYVPFGALEQAGMDYKSAPRSTYFGRKGEPCVSSSRR